MRYEAYIVKERFMMNSSSLVSTCRVVTTKRSKTAAQTRKV